MDTACSAGPSVAREVLVFPAAGMQSTGSYTMELTGRVVETGTGIPSDATSAREIDPTRYRYTRLMSERGDWWLIFTGDPNRIPFEASTELQATLTYARDAFYFPELLEFRIHYEDELVLFHARSGASETLPLPEGIEVELAADSCEYHKDPCGSMRVHALVVREVGGDTATIWPGATKKVGAFDASVGRATEGFGRGCADAIPTQTELTLWRRE